MRITPDEIRVLRLQEASRTNPTPMERLEADNARLRAALETAPKPYALNDIVIDWYYGQRAEALKEKP